MHRVLPNNRDMTVITAASRGETFCFLSTWFHRGPSAAHLEHVVRPLSAGIHRNPDRVAHESGGGNWLLGFGHDCENDFARVTADPKFRFALCATPDDPGQSPRR